MFELLAAHDESGVLRAVAESGLQLIMDADVDGVMGAGRHERAEGRVTHRNGCCDRALDTRLGALNLGAPRLRQGLRVPGFLEPRRTSETGPLPRALVFEPTADKARSSRRGSAAPPPAASMSGFKPWA